MKDSWIIPCNIKYFNVIEHFKKQNTVVWKNSFTMKEGDTAYLYLSQPYGEIKYKCTVVSNQVSEELLQKNSYAIVTKQSNNYFSKKPKYVELQLIGEYPTGKLTFEHLKAHGVGQFQIQARIPYQLKPLLEITESELIYRGDK